jgi:hemoglobin/transferrin/lactoferrin receptor protein
MTPSRFRLPAAGMTLLALAPLACAADNVDAASTPDPEELDIVVVHAVREPGNFRIDRKEIQLTQASDLSDLLSNESGVAVGGGSVVSQKIYVRGFEDTMLNVTVDGAQQPAELYHHQSRVQLEPEFIRTIELDAGAGPATQGAGALTGALKVTTRDAFDMLRPGQRFGALFKAAYGDNGDNRKAVASVYGTIGERVGVMASVVRQEGDHYEDGNGDRVFPTAFDHDRGQLKLSGRFDAHDVDLSIERLDDTGTYYERPHMTDFAGRFILSDHEMRRRSAAYRHRYDPDSALVDIEANLYRTAVDFQVRRNTTGLVYSRGEQVSTGIDARNTMRWGEASLVWGVDHRRDRLEAEQRATPPAFWGRTEQRADVYGAYVQGSVPLGETWTLSGGLRYDDYRHRGVSGVSAGIDNGGDGLSPNLSLEWKPVPSLTLRAAYAHAYRGITIREAFFGALYTYAEGLDGEHADNAEFGIAWEHDGAFARATVFRQTIDDYISAVYLGGAVWGEWRNIGRAEVEGYEAEIGKRWERWTVALGVWNSDNRFEDRPLNDADLGLGTSIGRTWTLRGDWVSASGRQRYGLRARTVESEANAISPTAPDKPGYRVVDLLAQWTPLDDDRLTLGLTVNNLFDRFYYDHGTYGYHAGSGKYIGFPSPGREIRVSAAWKF